MRSFGYDAAGNTTTDSARAFTATYDLSGRLKTLSKGGVTTTYTYDGFGRRVRKVSSTGTASSEASVHFPLYPWPRPGNRKDSAAAAADRGSV